MRITVEFSITAWEQSTFDEAAEGPPLNRALVRKAYQGHLEGESVAELTMCQTGEDGDPGAGAGYLATERITGRLGGRSGSFVVQHGAIGGPGLDHRFGHILPNSGTGELTGLRGTVEFQHGVATFDYAV